MNTGMQPDALLTSRNLFETYECVSEGGNESVLLLLTLALSLLLVSSSGTPRLVGNFFDFSLVWECIP